MKSITRLSLALMMFGLFSVSYLVTTVAAGDIRNESIRCEGQKQGCKGKTIDIDRDTRNDSGTTQGFAAVSADEERDDKLQGGVAGEDRGGQGRIRDELTTHGAKQGRIKQGTELTDSDR